MKHIISTSTFDLSRPARGARTALSACLSKFSSKYSRTGLSALLFGFACAALNAAPMEFDFKDPKGVNNIAFETDAPLESIKGNATGISGKVMFDPDKPESVNGKIVVAATSLHVPNSKMQEHLHSGMWIDSAKNPLITFEVLSASDVKTQGNITAANIVGKMTLKGTTKEMTIPVSITYLKDKLKERVGRDGDLLVLRSRFSVKRSDFGINPGQMLNKVADDIQLVLGIAGAAPKK